MTSGMEADGMASSSSSSSAAGPPSNASYRLFLGDTDGALKVFHAPCPPIASDYQSPLPETLEVQGMTSDADMSKALPSGTSSIAVQKMAAGELLGAGWVLAVARRNATIDVVLPSTEKGSKAAKLLVTIENDKMKAGLQRWVGIAVGTK